MGHTRTRGTKGKTTAKVGASTKTRKAATNWSTTHISKAMLRGASSTGPLTAAPTKASDLDAWLSNPALDRREDETQAEYHARLLSGADHYDGTAFVVMLDAVGLDALATLLRIRLGIDLLPEQPEKRRGRGRWQKTTARRLGMRARNLRNYLAAAEAVEEARLLATPLPIAVLLRPLDKIPAGIRLFIETGDLDAPPKPSPAPSPDQLKARWGRRAEHLVTDAQSLPDSLQALWDVRDRIGQEIRANAGVKAKVAGRKKQGAARQLPDSKQLTEQTVDLFQKADMLSLDDLKRFLDLVQIRSKLLQATVPQSRPVVWRFNRSGEIKQLVQPLFPYPGSKTTQLPSLMRRMGHVSGDEMNGDYTFREPFAGTAVVSVNMLQSGRANRVWLNDRDPAIAALLTMVIQDPDSLVQRIVALPRLTEAVFRDWMATLDDERATQLDLAVACLVVHWCTHGGQGRMAGGPRKEYLTDLWDPSEITKRIETYHRLLKGRVFQNCCTNLDALDVILAPGPCVLYVDPPYVKAGWKCYALSYNAHHHRALARALAETDQPWLLTYDNSDLIRELHADQILVEVNTRYISRASDKKAGKKGRKYRTWVVEQYICPKRHSYILDPPEEAQNPIAAVFGEEDGVESGPTAQEEATPPETATPEATVEAEPPAEPLVDAQVETPAEAPAEPLAEPPVDPPVTVQVPRTDLLEAIKVLPGCTPRKGPWAEPYSTHYLVRTPTEDHESGVDLLSFNGRQFGSVPLPTSTPGAPGTVLSFDGQGLAPWLRQSESDTIVIRQDGDGQVEVSDGQTSHLRASLDPEKYPFWDTAVAGANVVAFLSADKLRSALDFARQFVSKDRNGRPELRLTQVRDGTLWASDGHGVSSVGVRGLEDATFKLDGQDIPAIVRFLRTAGEYMEISETDRFSILHREDSALFGVSFPQDEMPKLASLPPEAEHWWDVARADLQQALRDLGKAPGKGDDWVRIAPPTKGRPARFAVKSGADKWVSKDIPGLEVGSVDGATPLPVRGRLVPRAHLVAAVRRWKGERARFAVHGVTVKGKQRWAICLVEENDGDTYTTVLPWDSSRKRTA